MKTFKDIIHEGGVAVMRTDTLYGIVADAHNPKAVDRVYAIKKRNPLKASIVLVSDYDQIRSFGIEIDAKLEQLLQNYWPGKVSIILPSTNPDVHSHYIHKGTGGIAFRIPADLELRSKLKEVGPLIAPSANPEGLPPARTIQEAVDYFGDAVDFYEDGGEVIDERASKIIAIQDNHEVVVIRD